VQSLALTRDAVGGYSVQVWLGGDLRTLQLHEHDLRGPSFELLVRDANGTHPQPRTPCVTYRGGLLEEPTARVAASIVDGSLTAIVYRPSAAPGTPGEDWVVQPVRRAAPQAGAAAHVVFLSQDSTPLPYVCGNADLPPPPGPAFGIDVVLECEIAIEADVQFYNQNGGNVVNTQNDITAVMNQVEFIYERDCDITYDVTTIVVTTTSVYTSNDASTLLSQFRNNWNSNFGGVQRDVAHLFTGRNLTGSTIGIASVSVICSQSSGYGLSQSRYSNNFNNRVGLTCHELGHNWSASHCNGANPCYIMCSGLGGCSGNVTLFSPTEIGQITSYAATRNCLAIATTAPTLNSLSPSDVAVFAPENVTLSGTGLSGATSFTVAGQSYTSGFTVLDDNTMTIAMPEGVGIGATTVGVTNPLGSSNQLPISYVATTPPRLRMPPTVPSTGGLTSFEFAGVPGRPWYLVISIFNATQPFQGFDLLEPFILLGSGVFPGPDGIMSVPIPVPGGLGVLPIYGQILEADAASPTATGTSNIDLMILL